MSATTNVTAWLVGNTMKVQLGELADPLKDPDLGTTVTTATVTVTVVDAAGVAITGETWPKTMTHVGGGAGLGDGVYRAYVAFGVAVLEGKRYVARITADFSGKRYYAEADVLGTIRTGATALT